MCLPAGYLPCERGEDACGEVVSGLRERQGVGGAVPVLTSRHQQRAQALPETGGYDSTTGLHVFTKLQRQSALFSNLFEQTLKLQCLIESCI